MICVQLLRMEPHESWPNEKLSIVVFNVDNGFLRGQPGIRRNKKGYAQRFVWCHMQIQLHDFSERPARSLTDEFFYFPFDYIDYSAVLFSRVFFIKCNLYRTLKRSFQFYFFSFFVEFRPSDDHRQIPFDCIELFQFSFKLFRNILFRFSQSRQSVVPHIHVKRYFDGRRLSSEAYLATTTFVLAGFTHVVVFHQSLWKRSVTFDAFDGILGAHSAVAFVHRQNLSLKQ